MINNVQFCSLYGTFRWTSTFMYGAGYQCVISGDWVIIQHANYISLPLITSEDRGGVSQHFESYIHGCDIVPMYSHCPNSPNNNTANLPPTSNLPLKPSHPPGISTLRFTPILKIFENRQDCIPRNTTISSTTCTIRNLNKNDIAMALYIAWHLANLYMEMRLKISIYNRTYMYAFLATPCHVYSMTIFTNAITAEMGLIRRVKSANVC